MPIPTDETEITFGKYKGTKLANVPASYLLWLYDNNKCGYELKTYIRNNHEQLEKEAKETKRN